MTLRIEASTKNRLVNRELSKLPYPVEGSLACFSATHILTVIRSITPSYALNGNTMEMPVLALQ